MAEPIVVSQYKAYLINDTMKYCLVQWTLDPWPWIVKNESLETDGGVAREGEWVCKGLWLNDVNCAPRWFWLSNRKVVIHCQFVLCSNLVLLEHNTDNKLPRMNVQYQESVLILKPICLSDENHDILMDVDSLREVLDYKQRFQIVLWKPVQTRKTWRRRMSLRVKVMKTKIQRSSNN